MLRYGIHSLLEHLKDCSENVKDGKEKFRIKTDKLRVPIDPQSLTSFRDHHIVIVVYILL